MSSIFVQILWQVDNLDSFKRTFLQQNHRHINPLLILKDMNRHTKASIIKKVNNTLTQIPHPMHNSSDM